MNTNFINQMFQDHFKVQKEFTATYMTFSNGDDDCGMETQDVKATDYNEAVKIAKEYPGRLYKLEEKTRASK